MMIIREKDIKEEKNMQKKYPWTGKRIHLFTLLSALLLIAMSVISVIRG